MICDVVDKKIMFVVVTFDVVENKFRFVVVTFDVVEKTTSSHSTSLKNKSCLSAYHSTLLGKNELRITTGD